MWVRSPLRSRFFEDVSNETAIFHALQKVGIPIFTGCLRRNAYFCLKRRKPDRTRTGSDTLFTRLVRERLVENIKETQNRSADDQHKCYQTIVSVCRAVLPCWSAVLLWSAALVCRAAVVCRVGLPCSRGLPCWSAVLLWCAVVVLVLVLGGPIKAGKKGH